MKKLAVLIAGAILVPLLTVQGSAEAGSTSPTRYHVKPGALFNLPNSKPLTIQNHIVEVLDHAPRHAQIRAMTWNFNEPAVTNALIRAHRRGATIRLIMARTLVGDEFKRLVRGLRWHNAGRQPANRSWARTCSHSCRGKGGSEHMKWVSVSKAGASHSIVMEGSFNLTTSAVRYQWNDWYTVVGDDKIYRTYRDVFTQATLDRKAWEKRVSSKFRTAWFAPLPVKHDPVMQILNRVRCLGAGDGSGVNGHTVIRVASAVIQADRGERIAARLHYLKMHGCNIRVLYTLSTHKVLAALKGVPVRHMAWDTDGDGAFNQYLHMKAMTVSGRYGDDRSAHVMFNGSANWSPMGLVSDEQGFIVKSKGLERRYTQHINYLWDVTGHNNGRAVTPRYSARTTTGTDGTQGTGGTTTDPYVDIRRELMG